jgi:membrane protease YdiL (CAAX protease family)
MVANGEDGFAARLRGFGPVGLLAILIVLAGNLVVAPLSAVLVLIWARISHTRWREIGYLRPKSWAGSLIIGVLLGATFKLLMKVIVMPLLGAPSINQAYHYLAGNIGAMPGMILVMIVVAGFGEETVYRGYMFERLGKLFGASSWAKYSSF